MRRIKWMILVVTSASAIFMAWLLWAPWPDPAVSKLPWTPDAIVILGGGDEDRVREGKRLADRFPEVKVVVTGDGGLIRNGLLRDGLAPDRLMEEPDAQSTYENATLTDVFLDKLKAERVAIVTNWFHADRSLAVFRKVQPEREFAVSFEAKPHPLTPWDRGAQRRERFAGVMYWVRYGVWSW